ncbi:hypothetical protein PsorP6_010424 [Peronosclerospora sorghi]|uniref:Uncharacterized protein n=1 Tax=Peronosclerospora sorghi TaxID=230839 RepID=A0ACC0VZ56_9STRA|nr:hypothetical protein PsorP6_010424 [Peronosclerospora sorghi]
MIRIALLLLFVVALVCSVEASIKHDEVEPFKQPKPTSVSEAAGVKFKPQLYIAKGCTSFPAVNSDGATSGGLKGTYGVDACEVAPLGSQVYGRAKQHKGVWAIMYSWYFPKSFYGNEPDGRHDWTSMIMWFDDITLEKPTVLGVSLSISATEYSKKTFIASAFYAGSHQLGYNRSDGSNTTIRVYHSTKMSSPAFLGLSQYEGEYQDLIMWSQLSDDARLALENPKNFKHKLVPFNDDNFLTGATTGARSRKRS